MYSWGCPDPDVIVRTSGEVRLSDFLLWQGSLSALIFFDVYWPEFSPWHLYKTVFFYQHHYHELQSQRQKYQQVMKSKEMDTTSDNFTAATDSERNPQGDMSSRARVENFLKITQLREERFFEELSQTQ
jgi:hypothetical protein